MIKKLSALLRVPKSVKNSKKASLVRSGTSRELKNSAFQNLKGTVKRHPDGFGFFIPEDPHYPDIYLPKREMLGLMSNDKVKIAIQARKPTGRVSRMRQNIRVQEKVPVKNGDGSLSSVLRQKGLFSGKVLQIVKRSQEFLVGQYLPLSDKKGLIRDESFQWGEDLRLQLKKNQKIQAKEWVQVKITHWPGSSQGLSGEIVCSLGLFPEALEDNIRVVQKHNLPASFSAECLKEAEQVPKSFSKDILDNRQDLRALAFATIDGKTAQDFDDAIYVSSDSKGWTLYVAIADVSHYVQKGSAMDKEALKRGNSVYFPGFTLPMLPEKLSNDLCSLKPGEDRLAFVAEMRFDKEGKRKKAQFYTAVIQSQARLNYGSAQEIIEQEKSTLDLKKTTTGLHSKVSARIKENVLSAEKLAQKLLQKRLKDHFINLEIPETEISLNSLGEPLDISQSRRLFSHQLIEELMLSANQAVAEYLWKNKTSTLYRIHDPPKPESLKLLESFIQGLSVKLKLAEPDLQKKISFLIKKFADHSLSEVLQILILRSLSQAVYSARNKKHFGLNIKYYTHFTSPIRRYSDLVVHRALKSALAKKSLPYKIHDLESLAETTSACEQRAVKAERQIKDIKRARFLKKHLGEEMEGTICSVTRFGFFVRLRLYDIEGLVHINSLNGQWELDESLLELKSKFSGFRFKMGDFVSIQVISANVDLGQIDFNLLTHKGKKESWIFKNEESSSGSLKGPFKKKGAKKNVNNSHRKRKKRAKKTHKEAKSGRKTRAKGRRTRTGVRSSTGVRTGARAGFKAKNQSKSQKPE